MNGTGLYITGLLNSDGSCIMDKESSNIWLSNSKFKSTADGQPVTSHNADGVYADCSSNLSIGGVSACPGNQICNSFDYDSGFGVYLQNTQNSTIDRASANADDTAGYVLDNSSGVTLSNSGGGSDGPICFSSNGQRGPTGYMTNNMQGNLLLIRGSQDNTIQNDQFAAPIGGDSIHSGGNTFYYDPCSKSKITPSPLPPGWLPPDAGMGSGNMFPGTCYRSTNIVGLPPAPCK
jgi:hypothetical protein